MKRFIFFLGMAIVLAGCSKKEPPVTQIAESSKDHEWYFFTRNGIEKTSLPQKSGISSLNPWTETLRASDANTAADGSGYMVVNRSGVIYFDASQQRAEPVLIQDYELFSSSTASTLIFDRENPYITFSRSSFFNKDASLEPTAENSDPNRPFLVRISAALKSFYPAITYGDLNLSSGGEITGTFFDGTDFLSCIKTLKNSRVQFSYITFKANQPLETLAPYTQSAKITVSPATDELYRSKNSPQKFSAAPKRLKNLLASIPAGFDFSILCKNTNGTSPRLYTNSTESDRLTQANAILADGWICAIFSDGTTYFNGALSGRHILNEGKNAAFRLPKLPENYIYGAFCIVNSTLAVAWEETDFYKTGRSGFLLVDLGKVLYGDF